MPRFVIYGNRVNKACFGVKLYVCMYGSFLKYVSDQVLGKGYYLKGTILLIMLMVRTLSAMDDQCVKGTKMGKINMVMFRF